MASGVAGAFNFGASGLVLMLATASRMASQTDMASMSGGSPTALDLKIVEKRLGASSNIWLSLILI